MSFNDLSSLDLNLLWVLQVVLEEESATRAAARLHVTQSAVSGALRRLRDLFGDPLVVRTAHGLAPTPFAVRLKPVLAQAVSGVREVMASAGSSTSARSERRYTLACTDVVSMVLVPGLLARMAKAMPAASLRVVTLERAIATDGLERGDVDLLVGIPPSRPPGCAGELVMDDPRVCIVRQGNPAVRGALTLAQYARLPHVELALFGEPHDDVDRALARRGLARSIALAVPHFSSIPLAVAATDTVATVSARLAHLHAQTLPLRVLAPPVPLPPLRVMQHWHRRAAHDEGLTRLRELLREVARTPARAGPSRQRSARRAPS